MPKKRDFLSLIGSKLELPREALPGGFALMLSGQEELTVRGCKKILVYERQTVTLSLGRVFLTVSGDALFCSAFGGGAVTLSGKIDTLSFSKGERI
ncbi:MAG: YabP/YqfC family sporulation protein [Clostridia bacterium]|nr:YabP/YqfC family sporulation protein [Clostridia bacterium]